MPIEYNVSQNGLRIETFPKGELNIKKTIDHFARLKNDPKIKQGAIEIVSFKHVTDFKISYLECEEITKCYQTPKALLMIDATIFFCESDLAYGIGRMLKALHEITNPRHKAAVARTENELDKLIKDLTEQ